MTAAPGPDAAAALGGWPMTAAPGPDAAAALGAPLVAPPGRAVLLVESGPATSAVQAPSRTHASRLVANACDWVTAPGGHKSEIWLGRLPTFDDKLLVVAAL